MSNMDDYKMRITPRKLFVCGCPKSGTSAVADWLSRHPQVAIGMERYQSYWNAHLQFPENAFEKERFFSPREGDSWYSSLDQFSSLYERATANWDDAFFVGDKVSGLWRNLDGIFERFPHAKVMCTFRDPFAVARSYKECAANSSGSTWGRHRDVSYGIIEWNEWARSILDFFNSDSEVAFNRLEKVLLLEYERFVSNCLDRRVVDAFLSGGRQPLGALPSVAQRAASTATPGTALSEAEMDLAWSLLDASAVQELKVLSDVQSRHLRRAGSRSARAGRREWYHTEDKKAASIDYGELQLPGCNFVFRGREKALDLAAPFVACIGSATTFGRFVRHPYPDQMERLTAIPFLNLGIGGARPEAYLTNDGLIEVLKRSSSVVIELMSARGYPCPVFQPVTCDGNHGLFSDFFGWSRHRGEDAELDWLLDKGDKREVVFVDRVFEIGFKYLSSADRDLVRDSLVSAYLRDLDHLVREIGRPVTFLLITRAAPSAARGNLSPAGFAQWSGEYPHFIDAMVVNLLRQRGHTVVESRSGRGFPSVVLDWRSGQPVPVFPWQQRPELNAYYPTQEMHDDAFNALSMAPQILRLRSTQSPVTEGGVRRSVL